MRQRVSDQLLLKKKQNKKREEEEDGEGKERQPQVRAQTQLLMKVQSAGRDQQSQWRRKRTKHSAHGWSVRGTLCCLCIVGNVANPLQASLNLLASQHIFSLKL